MWDDLTPFLVGAGPTSTVLDPDGTPNNILDTAVGGSVQVDWSFSGSATGFLVVVNFIVDLYADPVGPGMNIQVGENQVLGSAPLPSPPAAPNSYSTSFPIAPGMAPGAYRLTTLVTTVLTGTTTTLPIAGFVDGPIIQVRPGP